ncbi:thiamine phosphate synthase [Chamaesiphon sp. VAR_48_metabat_403]|uniref:thiamine phosphate synthase n=1 Tax=Chamaesiphon sp. VAR_48_metabat_403 TaxID=2964700 RepID=UPI00286E0985|nr:thiamine phosphate synthase [Chamaesiphon sp. VAR_48_metabat_403]
MLDTSLASIQPAVWRILDANFDRAREGLRIIEEWCRFALNNSALASECKQMRQELGMWHTPEIRSARDTSGDVGTALSHPREEQRTGIEQLLQANLCRIQEALRVLEEYGKLYSPNLSSGCKQMRYRVYTLESNLLAYRRRQLLTSAKLYLVTAPSPDLLPRVEAALQGGLTLVQYRDKQANDIDRLAIARQMCQLCHNYGALFILNDRVDLALAVDADGVHLGQQDVSIALARQILGSQRIVGKSTTNPSEMAQAIKEGADYIGVGPVYETPTKAGKAAAGLEYVQHAAKNATIPWFAIGGIDNTNIDDVLQAGAPAIAIVRAIMNSETPTQAVQSCLAMLNRVPQLGSRG